jgi:TRAP-type C4-dicarboxylate transport system permease small subunit
MSKFLVFAVDKPLVGEGSARESEPMIATLHTALDRVLKPVEITAALIAGAMMLAAMVMNTADALLRYLLNSPLKINYFVTENYLMVGLICLPMAWAFRTGGYIRISLLLNSLPRQAGDLLLRAGLLASGIYCADLAWLSAGNWFETYEKGSIEMGVYDWPWHWSWIWVPLGMGILALRLLVMAIGPSNELAPQHEFEEEAV